MRFCLFLLALVGQLLTAHAQTTDNPPPSSNLRIGYSLGLSYNFYSWYRPPSISTNFEIYSTGQVLNILPGLHAGVWIGDVEHGLLSLQTELSFLPFALSLQQYSGLGVLEVPTLIKFQLPISRQQSLWTFVHLGAGVQWQAVDLYDKRPFSTHAQQYMTWVGEIGFHLSAVAHSKHKIRELEYFVRIGAAPNGAFSANTGLRLCFRNGTK